MKEDSGNAEEEAAKVKAAADAQARKERKKELKRAKSIKKQAAKEARLKKEAEDAAQPTILEFVVQLDQPLGMKIDHVDGHDIYPAEITAVVADGQADKAGVKEGMMVTAMNGEPTNGQELDDIVQGVIAAKTEQTPLTMTLQLN
jgi:predicted metalloprotease with PDZ domain